MISVGLDIPRLGLMVVLGQPKTHAEYIQATSRVGRDDERPGLVVTLLNIHKPRDRSHYERFRHYHETFYRSVEVASVTPFSARALDRGFAGALIGLARHCQPELTPPLGAEQIADVRAELERRLLEIFLRACPPAAARRRSGARGAPAQRAEPDRRPARLLAQDRRGLRAGRRLGAVPEVRVLKQPRPLLREMLDTDFESEHHRKFRVNRSLRDVEPEVNLFLKDLTGTLVEDER